MANDKQQQNPVPQQAPARQTYRLVAGKLGRWEDTGQKDEQGRQIVAHRLYDVSEKIELTAEEAARYGARVKLIGGAPPTPGQPDYVAAVDPESIVSKGYRDAIDAIGELQTVSAVEAVLKAERAERDRTTVIEAARERILQLREGTGAATDEEG